MKWTATGLLVLLAAGCAQPPAQELELATQRLARAREEGASRYAEDLYRQAEDALARARTAYSQGGPYRETLRFAAVACLRADEARRDTGKQKSRIARETHRCLRECAALIEEARSRGGGTLEGSELASLGGRHAAIESALAKGRVSEAYEAARQLKDELLRWLGTLEQTRHRDLDKSTEGR